MSDEFYSGKRLSYSGALCTVRYVGPVIGTKGEWLGVEWDDSSRGKHNGSHEGVKYFNCQSKASHIASFVRPSRPYDQSRSFSEALKTKYAYSENDDSVKGAKIQIGPKVVEEIGFDKIRKQLAMLSELRIVLLDGLCISDVQSQPWLEDFDMVKDQTLQIVELDLSRNVFEEWAGVMRICTHLKCLKTLKVNGNRFRDLSLPTLKKTVQPFETVKELSLDETFLTWDEIVEITTHFPYLTTLSVGSNNLTDITSPLRTPHLTSLSLNSNSITSLSALSHVSHLNLLSLSLRSNPINSLSSPVSFGSLTHLDLMSTLIASFTSLSPIPAIMPALSCLLATKTPLANISSASLVTIARLPVLTSLNFSRITPTERRNAELYYLKFVAREISAAASKQEKMSVLEDNPRYDELCKIHGEMPTSLEETAGDRGDGIDPGTLEARLVKLMFYMVTEAGVVEKSKELPHSMDIYQIKGVVGRLFGVRPLGCKLIWETEQVDRASQEEWSCNEVDEDESEDGNRASMDEKDSNLTAKPDESSIAKHNPPPAIKTFKEEELADGTRKLSYWIEDKVARVRVELR